MRLPRRRAERLTRMIQPRLGCIVALAACAFGQAKFEVASIKPCTAERPSFQRGVGNIGPQPSPGRLHLSCVTLERLIEIAYLQYGDGSFRPFRTRLRIPVDSAAEWLYSAKYDVIAKAAGAPSAEVMNGSMLRALLEERFQLSIRRETRQAPVYAVTVAKDGPKLSPFQAGSCVPRDWSSLEQSRNVCIQRMSFAGPNMIVQGQGMTVPDFAERFLGGLNRPVVDRTGLSGRFDFPLEFAPDETTPGIVAPRGLARLRGDSDPAAPAAVPAGPSIFTAVEQQLGLKLQPTTGPREFLLVDRVERPSEN
jgi:uncharacterized protein (TIGR03435 family)